MTKEQKRIRRIKNKKLREWSLAIRERANFQCEWCGRTKAEVRLNAHHIVTKKFEPLRFSLDNGICLCPKCHKFAVLSAHNNPIKVFIWLKVNRLESLKNLIEALEEI
jgi:hypothetical protein